jgi:hypothetical protein
MMYRKKFWISIRKAKSCLYSRRNGYTGKIILGYSVCIRLFNIDIMDNRGSRQTNSILNEIDVKKIKELIRTGLSKRLIAIQYGVARETIQSIATKRTWKHIN